MPENAILEQHKSGNSQRHHNIEEISVALCEREPRFAAGKFCICAGFTQLGYRQPIQVLLRYCSGQVKLGLFCQRIAQEEIELAIRLLFEYQQPAIALATDAGD